MPQTPPLPLPSRLPAELLLEEEAARYALLRRLAPAIRHDLLGEFQPIGMLSAIMDRRLQDASPNLLQLRENSTALGQLSRTAASAFSDLFGWIAPKKDATTALGPGVRDCLAVLATEFRFRGVQIVNDVGELPVSLRLAALRSVLPAALIALSDQRTEAADLQLRAQQQGADLRLSAVLRPAERPADNGPVTEYRALRWRDVQVLAQAEAVGFRQTADTFELTFTALS
jgi:hypothetical protein